MLSGWQQPNRSFYYRGALSQTCGFHRFWAHTLEIQFFYRGVAPLPPVQPTYRGRLARGPPTEWQAEWLRPTKPQVRPDCRCHFVLGMTELRCAHADTISGPKETSPTRYSLNLGFLVLRFKNLGFGLVIQQLGIRVQEFVSFYAFKYELYWVRHGWMAK